MKAFNMLNDIFKWIYHDYCVNSSQTILLNLFLIFYWSIIQKYSASILNYLGLSVLIT